MLTEKQMAELEAKHGRIARLKDPQGKWEVVLRKPTRPEYKAFRARSHNPAQIADAQEQLVRQIVVHPTPEAFGNLLDDYPGIAESPAASKALQALTGMAAEEDSK